MITTMFPVAVLAGGLATRLRPLTETLPKALIEIKGEPFVFHQLRLLAHQKIRKVVLCVGFLGEHIEQAVGDGSQFGLEVYYSYDGPHLRGTAGAIRNALPLLGDHFFVMYGDSYLTCDMATIQQAFVTAKRMGLMTVFHNLGEWDSSNVIFKNNEILVYDKINKTAEMDYIDYGLGVFSANAFRLPEVKAMPDLADLYGVLLRKSTLAAFEVKERFYEIGSFAGIKELTQQL